MKFNFTSIYPIFLRLEASMIFGLQTRKEDADSLMKSISVIATAKETCRVFALIRI